MKKIKIIYGIISLLLSFVFVQPTWTADVKKVAMIGSSSFAGFCGMYKYHDALTNLLPDYKFDCFYQNGAEASWFLQQFNSKVKSKGYNDVIVYAGLNGLFTQTNLNSAQADLNTLFTAAKKENIRIIVVSAQPFRGYEVKKDGQLIAKWNQQWGDNIIANNAWAKSNPNVNVFIDTYSHYDDGTGMQKKEFYEGSDYLHVNKNGYKLMFQLIAQDAYGQPQGLDPIQNTGNQGNTGGQNPAQNASLFDDLYRGYKEKSLTESELQKFLQQPNPRIKIPGLSFSDISLTDLSADTDGGLYVNFPFLGEYISAIYKYAIVVAGIVSVILLVVAGIEWMMTGENIERAKKRIANAIIGLILSVGSYSILYLVNPELVNLRSLRVRVIQGTSLLESMSSGDFSDLTNMEVPSKNDMVNYTLKYGKEAGITDPCLVLVILKTESGANPLAIGHDENYAGKNVVSARKNFLMDGMKKNNNETFAPPVENPSQYVASTHNKTKIKNNDKFVNVPPDYGLDWKYSHGFGAGQITFGGSEQCNNERGRILKGKCYTIPILLNPLNNLALTANFVKDKYDYAAKIGLSGKNQIIGAFYAYEAGNAGLSKKLKNSKIDDGTFVPIKVANYDKCKADTAGYIQGITGITPNDVSENMSIEPDWSAEETT